MGQNQLSHLRHTGTHSHTQNATLNVVPTTPLSSTRHLKSNPLETGNVLDRGHHPETQTDPFRTYPPQPHCSKLSATNINKTLKADCTDKQTNSIEEAPQPRANSVLQDISHVFDHRRINTQDTIIHTKPHATHHPSIFKKPQTAP